ncbi:VP2 [Lutzomyia reovirus 1]|uniref:VP2 n=1 Tax=Lutzomyia reovirus 1 TaxID=1670669 RepID=UPI00065EEB6A|nr:VP2 [Lutzomyia reovirus 1]AKP18608.1 VP2 [Lutzomyia reovirus 1]
MEAQRYRRLIALINTTQVASNDNPNIQHLLDDYKQRQRLSEITDQLWIQQPLMLKAESYLRTHLQDISLFPPRQTYSIEEYEEQVLHEYMENVDYRYHIIQIQINPLLHLIGDSPQSHIIKINHSLSQTQALNTAYYNIILDNNINRDTAQGSITITVYDDQHHAITETQDVQFKPYDVATLQLTYECDRRLIYDDDLLAVYPDDYDGLGLPIVTHHLTDPSTRITFTLVTCHGRNEKHTLQEPKVSEHTLFNLHTKQMTWLDEHTTINADSTLGISINPGYRRNAMLNDIIEIGGDIIAGQRWDTMYYHYLLLPIYYQENVDAIRDELISETTPMATSSANIINSVATLESLVGQVTQWKERIYATTSTQVWYELKNVPWTSQTGSPIVLRSKSYARNAIVTMPPQFSFYPGSSPRHEPTEFTTPCAYTTQVVLPGKPTYEIATVNIMENSEVIVLARLIIASEITNINQSEASSLAPLIGEVQALGSRPYLYEYLNLHSWPGWMLGYYRPAYTLTVTVDAVFIGLKNARITPSAISIDPFTMRITNWTDTRTINFSSLSEGEYIFNGTRYHGIFSEANETIKWEYTDMPYMYTHDNQRWSSEYGDRYSYGLIGSDREFNITRPLYPFSDTTFTINGGYYENDGNGLFYINPSVSCPIHTSSRYNALPNSNITRTHADMIIKAFNITTNIRDIDQIAASMAYGSLHIETPVITFKVLVPTDPITAGITRSVNQSIDLANTEIDLLYGLYDTLREDIQDINIRLNEITDQINRMLEGPPESNIWLDMLLGFMQDLIIGLTFGAVSVLVKQLTIVLTKTINASVRVTKNMIQLLSPSVQRNIQYMTSTGGAQIVRGMNETRIMVNSLLRIRNKKLNDKLKPQNNQISWRDNDQYVHLEPTLHLEFINDFSKLGYRGSDLHTKPLNLGLNMVRNVEFKSRGSIYFRPLASLPTGIGNYAHRKITLSSVHANGKAAQLAQLKTTYPSHAYCVFQEPRRIDGKFKLDEHIIGIGELNIQGTPTGDTNAGIGAFRIRHDIIGADISQGMEKARLITRLTPYTESGYTDDQMRKIYKVWMGNRTDLTLSPAEMYRRLSIYADCMRLNSTNTQQFNLPDTSRLNALQLLMHDPPKWKYNIFNRNCQNMAYELRNYVLFGETNKTWTAELAGKLQTYRTNLLLENIGESPV